MNVSKLEILIQAKVLLTKQLCITWTFWQVVRYHWWDMTPEIGPTKAVYCLSGSSVGLISNTGEGRTCCHPDTCAPWDNWLCTPGIVTPRLHPDLLQRFSIPLFPWQPPWHNFHMWAFLPICSSLSSLYCAECDLDRQHQSPGKLLLYPYSYNWTCISLQKI